MTEVRELRRGWGVGGGGWGVGGRGWGVGGGGWGVGERAKRKYSSNMLGPEVVFGRKHGSSLTRSGSPK